MLLGGSPGFQARIRCDGGSNIPKQPSGRTMLEIDVKRGKVHQVEVVAETGFQVERSKSKSCHHLVAYCTLIQPALHIEIAMNVRFVRFCDVTAVEKLGAAISAVLLT